MEFIIEKQPNKLWRNIAAYKQYLNDLPAGRYKVIVENEDKRTLQQNKWIHQVLPDILMGLRAVGYDDIKTTEQTKDFIKSMFFRKSVSNGIDTVEVVQGTSKTSKLDFTSRAEDIIKWAAEYLSIDIAPPDKQLEVFNNNDYERSAE